jgi:HSP20 family protein
MVKQLGDRGLGISLRDAVDRLLGEAFVQLGARDGDGREHLVPPVNMYETATDLVIVLPMPGVSPRDVEIELQGTQLTVRTPVRRDVPHVDTGVQEKHRGHDPDAPPGRQRYLRHEFQIGPYERTIQLPYAVDSDRVDTTYEHGLLTLRSPRPNAQTPRRIPVQGH